MPSSMPGAGRRGGRVYCWNVEVWTVAEVHEVNRTTGLLWYVVTSIEDRTRPEAAQAKKQLESRSICEGDADEPTAAYAPFNERDPAYLKSYQRQTVRIRLLETTRSPVIRNPDTPAIRSVLW